MDLHGLVRNKGLVISKADKGDITVIMTTSPYHELAYRKAGNIGGHYIWHFARKTEKNQIDGF